jgi:hypothetical protein
MDFFKSRTGQHLEVPREQTSTVVTVYLRLMVTPSAMPRSSHAPSKVGDLFVLFCTIPTIPGTQGRPLTTLKRVATQIC